MNLPKELCIFDLETFPEVAYIYGSHWEPVVVGEKESGKILSIAYAFGDGKVHFKPVWDWPNYHDGLTINDRPLVEFIAKEILPKCKILGGQNLDSFDVKTIQERMRFYEMKPPEIFLTYDTKKLYKKYYRNPESSLDYLSGKYNKGGKIPHEGKKLYLKAGLGDVKAQKVLKRYNIGDVEKTRDLLRPVLEWENRSKPIWENKLPCPDCGSTETKRDGIRTSKQGKFQVHFCNNCGRTFRGKQIIQKV